jgi:hypothetical protein
VHERQRPERTRDTMIQLKTEAMIAQARVFDHPLCDMGFATD